MGLCSGLSEHVLAYLCIERCTEPVHEGQTDFLPALMGHSTGVPFKVQGARAGRQANFRHSLRRQEELLY